MQSYKAFIFDSYDFDAAAKRLDLHYSLDDDIRFTESITFHGFIDPTRVDPVTLDRAFAALHLMGGISYYKTCVPKEIVLKTHPLSPDQAAFWNTVYEKGLGEFFYRNDIDFRGLIRFPVGAETEADADGKTAARNMALEMKTTAPKALVPIGGGKDSMVTIELLRAAGIPQTLFRMGKHPLIEALAKEAGLPLLTIDRKLPDTLFKLNADGALNGHVPITGYLSFLGVITALLTGHNAFVLSNERSASEGNVLFHGMEINHQWSKSVEFEKAFAEYVRRFVTPDVAVFSLLRPLSELSITSAMRKHPQYLQLITSCNDNWKILKEKGGKKWCGRCPKCAFSFALFAAFLDKHELTAMFGSNLFEDPSLLPLYRELLGLAGFKPFECVGTAAETRAAFSLAHERGDLDSTPAMKMYLKEVSSPPTDEDIAGVLLPDDATTIPPAFLPALDEAC